MTIYQQIKKVKESNFKKEEVKKVMEMEILPKCKYGNFLLALAVVSVAAKTKEQEKPLIYKDSQEKEALEKSFEMEDFVASEIGINDDEFSNLNCKLLNDYIEEIKTYAA